jgi:hypothetical protein
MADFKNLAGDRQGGLHTRQESAGVKKQTRKDVLTEIAKYKELLDQIPDPNEGRIRELKDLIQKGKLINRESIRESAMRIAERFQGLP